MIFQNINIYQNNLELLILNKNLLTFITSKILKYILLIWIMNKNCKNKNKNQFPTTQVVKLGIQIFIHSRNVYQKLN